jgi:hypothetical protein
MYTYIILSTLSLVLSLTAITLSSNGDRFEGGWGYAGCFLFLIAAAISLVISIMLYRHWPMVSIVGKIAGLVGCLPLLTVVLVLVYVLLSE